MSLQSMLTIHQVTVLEPNPVVGSAAGVDRDYEPAHEPRVIDCRVVPQSAFKSVQLGMEAQTIVHLVEFLDPPNIDERNWLRWEGVGMGLILRIIRIPKPDALFRKWQCLCEARSEDQSGATIV